MFYTGIPRSRHDRREGGDRPIVAGAVWRRGDDAAMGEQRLMNTVECRECGISSGAFWIRWRAYRCDDPEQGEAPSLAFYCPACADREFGRPHRARTSG
jgi:hypothetical protein